MRPPEIQLPNSQISSNQILDVVSVGFWERVEKEVFGVEEKEMRAGDRRVAIGRQWWRSIEMWVRDINS